MCAFFAGCVSEMTHRTYARYGKAAVPKWYLESCAIGEWLPDLLDLLDLLIQATNHVVGTVRNLLHLHEADQGIHLGRQQ